jgi:hypothetical protein
MHEGQWIRRLDLSNNGFYYVMGQRPIAQDENVQPWMFFISGLTNKDKAGISQLKFSFRDSSGEQLQCSSPYSLKTDRPLVIGRAKGDLVAMPKELFPANLRRATISLAGCGKTTARLKNAVQVSRLL